MEREETKGAREDSHSSLKPSQVRKGQNFRPKIFSPRERICYSGESMSIGESFKYKRVNDLPLI